MGVRAPDACDVIVAGSGPAGATAALALARAGVRVALVDPADFPRDKACGDLVGPRGVALLRRYGIVPARAQPVGDVVVVGPSGRRVRLPWPAGTDFDPGVLAVPRADLDAAVRDAALEAGAEPVAGRVAEVVGGADAPREVVLADGRRLRCRAVIGADGAMSRVARATGLVRPGRVLWGFALRLYVDADVPAPVIAFWEPDEGPAIPGYGWLFPGPDGQANLGLGIGMGSDRGRAALAGQLLPAFVASLRADGLLQEDADVVAGGRRGGWMRMGLAGSSAGAGRVLLAGDAAGLVNPLQGEGIAEALLSGESAAHALLAEGLGAGAGARHRRTIGERHGPFHPAAGALHAAMVARPRAISRVGRLLTAPGVRRVVAGGWGIYWNDLRQGSRPGRARAMAAVLAGVSDAAMAASPVRRDARAGLVAGAERSPARVG